jgi:hypothetical protein
LEEQRKMEQLQEKYIRWTLEIDRSVPRCIVLAEGNEREKYLQRCGIADGLQRR